MRAYLCSICVFVCVGLCMPPDHPSSSQTNKWRGGLKFLLPTFKALGRNSSLMEVKGDRRESRGQAKGSTEQTGVWFWILYTPLLHCFQDVLSTVTLLVMNLFTSLLAAECFFSIFQSVNRSFILFCRINSVLHRLRICCRICFQAPPGDSASSRGCPVFALHYT